MTTPWLNKQVLIVGDSMSDGTSAQPGTYGVPPTPPRTPGQLLAQALEQQGAKPVRIQAKGGRSASHFVVHEGGLQILAGEVANYRPDVAIIILGTNDMLVPEAPTRTAFAQMKRIFDDAKIPVYHVGPPAFDPSLQSHYAATLGANYNTLAEMVVRVGRDLFGPRFIDARPMTSDTLTTAQGRSSGLVHFAMSGAQRWATRMSTALTSALAGVQHVAAPMSSVAKLAGGFLLAGGLATIGLLVYGAAAKHPTTPLVGRKKRYVYCGRFRVSADEIRKGIGVEQEHTKHIADKRRARVIARQIACDHVAPEPVGENIPDYYTRLTRMEREARAAQKEKG
jgi:lysophospholipase L1-like esterase